MVLNSSQIERLVDIVLGNRFVSFPDSDAELEKLGFIDIFWFDGFVCDVKVSSEFETILKESDYVFDLALYKFYVSRSLG